MIPTFQQGHIGRTILLPSGPHLTKLQTYFDGNDSTDISYYLNGAGTIVTTGTGSGITLSGDAFRFYAQGSPTPGGYLSWISSEICGHSGPITLEWFDTMTSNKNVSYTRTMHYWPNSNSVEDSYSFGLYATEGLHVFNGTNYEAASGRTHHAFVFGATERRYYINGVLKYSLSSGPPGTGTTGEIRLGDGGYNNNEIDDYSIDEFRIRYEEVYTGSSFTPPTNLPAPD